MLDQLRSLGTEPPRTIELNCLVRGETRRNIFPVKISPAETTGTLRKSIAEERKHAFQHVDPCDLVLWQVSILSDANLNKNVNNLELDEGGSLSGSEKLSELFPEGAAEGRVHILVKSPGELVLPPAFVMLSNLRSLDPMPPPLIDLNCWVAGEPPERVFSIKIEATEKVSALKKAIKAEKKPAFDIITADSLDLWKVSIPVGEDDLEGQLKSQNVLKKRPLSSVKLLSEIFQDVVKENVHVVVRIAQSECYPKIRCLCVSNNTSFRR